MKPYQKIPRLLNCGINLTSKNTFEVLPNQSNAFAETYILNKGQVLISFKNFTNESQFFTFKITQCNEAGEALLQRIDEIPNVQTTEVASAQNLKDNV